METAEELVGSSDATFLLGSKEIATKLAESQLARRIPGGKVIVFEGTVGAASVPFVGVIKAEPTGLPALHRRHQRCGRVPEQYFPHACNVPL
ncbi:hypothetical protein [Mesorhizobium sp.]|uniref:hypothetical protein n=1 Tax=Mesorhizobium sp. TaxID=1871066 RepID=UPI000FE4FF00|nr:hypothetical protein [Mesorhizobium sp.]RWP54338.1 MAG: hypothetical protein EOR07_34070 [Mesorhizobium sp.]